MKKNNVYEAHITVRCKGEKDYIKFFNSCEKIGIKGIRIHLDKGKFPTHLISGSYHVGAFEKVKREIIDIGRELETLGHEVLRYKAEAINLDNPQIPVNEKDALSRPLWQYFEFHFKVRGCHTNNDLVKLKKICKKHNAHLSRSASSRNKEGYESRFVTTRYRTSKEKAIELENNLINDIKKAGFNDIYNFLKEYTVWDTNLEHDRGWSH